MSLGKRQAGLRQGDAMIIMTSPDTSTAYILSIDDSFDACDGLIRPVRARRCEDGDSIHVFSIRDVDIAHAVNERRVVGVCCFGRTGCAVGTGDQIKNA